MSIESFRNAFISSSCISVEMARGWEQERKYSYNIGGGSDDRNCYIPQHYGFVLRGPRSQFPLSSPVVLSSQVSSVFKMFVSSSYFINRLPRLSSRRLQHCPGTRRKTVPRRKTEEVEDAISRFYSNSDEEEEVKLRIWQMADYVKSFVGERARVLL